MACVLPLNHTLPTRHPFHCENYKIVKFKLLHSRLYTAVSRKVVQLKSIKAYATIPKGMMDCGCSLLHHQVHEFSARWKAVL